MFTCMLVTVLSENGSIICLYGINNLFPVQSMDEHD